jgi:hypothetical protein
MLQHCTVLASGFHLDGMFTAVSRCRLHGSHVSLPGTAFASCDLVNQEVTCQLRNTAWVVAMIPAAPIATLAQSVQLTHQARDVRNPLTLQYRVSAREGRRNTYRDLY